MVFTSAIMFSLHSCVGNVGAAVYMLLKGRVCQNSVPFGCATYIGTNKSVSKKSLCCVIALT
jgi:hypothetical protein